MASPPLLGFSVSFPITSFDIGREKASSFRRPLTPECAEVTTCISSGATTSSMVAYHSLLSCAGGQPAFEAFTRSRTVRSDEILRAELERANAECERLRKENA